MLCPADSFKNKSLSSEAKLVKSGNKPNDSRGEAVASLLETMAQSGASVKQCEDVSLFLVEGLSPIETASRGAPEVSLLKSASMLEPQLNYASDP
jgi:hypothetical protein